MRETGDAGGLHRLRHALRAMIVHGLVGLASARRQHADEIDRGVRAPQRRLDRLGIAQIGLHGGDLPDAPERLEMESEVGAAHRRAPPPAALGPRPRHVTAEEARSAEHRDQPAVCALALRHLTKLRLHAAPPRRRGQA